VRRADVGFILILAATWGAVYPLTSMALRQVNPQDVVFARTATAALVLIPFAVRGNIVRAVCGRWAEVLAAAVLQAAIPLVLLTIGQQHVSASVAGIIAGTQPVIVALLAFAVPGARRPGWQAIVGITIGLAGIVLLFSDDLGASGTSLLAGLAVLGSAIFFALGAVWIDARLADVPPLGVATAAMCVTAIALLPFAAISAALPTPRTAVVLLTLGAIGTSAALVLFYRLIQRTGAARAGIAFYLAPGFAVLYGAVLLHDKLTPAILAGLAMITAGSLLALTTRPPHTRTPED
jgi:drug/metabolite transporter (DMT)-like permease